jgi:hypothetical protein
MGQGLSGELGAEMFLWDATMLIFDIGSAKE